MMLSPQVDPGGTKPAVRHDAASSRLSPRLLRAYRETCYEACGITARIGRRSARLDDVLRKLRGASGGFVTAWNPASGRLTDAANRRPQKRLIASLRGVRFVAAQGSLRRWREAHVLVAADPRLLATTARRFGQAAIVVLRLGQRARLHLL